MKSSEIRALNPEEIKSKLADAREELMKFRVWKPSCANRWPNWKVKHEQSSSHDWCRYQ